MARLEFLSALLNGKSFTLSVTEGANSATRNIVDWNVETGSATINVDRTSLQVAPDSVRMSVTLPVGFFDAAGPSPGAIYDPQLHDLIYIWDTGDTGVWDAPQRCLSQWRDKSVARGPWVAHCYTSPGTYAVTVMIIEPASGKVATASTSITVGDANVAYAGAATVCINPPGSSATGWGPAGASYRTMDVGVPEITLQSWWAGVNDGGGRRFLFDPGQTYPKFGFYFNGGGDASSLFIGGYGGQVTVPQILDSDITGGRIITIEGGYRPLVESPDVRIQNLIVEGDYDATTELPQPAEVNRKGGLILANRHGDFVVHNCGARENYRTAYMFYAQNIGDKGSKAIHSHLDNCFAENFGGQYSGAFWGIHDEFGASTMATTGCRFDHDPNGLNGGSTLRGPWRDEGHKQVYVRASEVYNKDDSNTGFKFCNTPNNAMAQHIVNVSGIVSEGGLVQAHFMQNIFQSTAGGQSFDINAILDQAILIGDYSTFTFVEVVGTGLSMRNALCILPNTASLTDTSAGVDLDVVENAQGANYIYKSFFRGVSRSPRAGTPQIVLDQPVDVYNCHMINERPQNVNGEFNDGMGAWTPDVTVANNVLKGAWAEQSGDPDAPLASATLFAPINTGFRGAATGTLRTQFATPAGAIASYAPQSGSSAIDNALSGKTAYDDILGSVRIGAKDRGAWLV